MALLVVITKRILGSCVKRGEIMPDNIMDAEEINKRFTYHAPHGQQPELYEELRRKARALATFIILETPASREQSLAITKLEEAIFWANAGIARRTPK